MVARYLVFLLLLLGPTASQVSEAASVEISGELDFISSHSQMFRTEGREDSSVTAAATSEIGLLCIGLIRFYQSFISSQQDNSVVCVFTPSCSRFARAAISKYGAFHGILATSDRLQRCHAFGRKFYPQDSQTGRLYDPIEPYHLGADPQ